MAEPAEALAAVARKHMKKVKAEHDDGIKSHDFGPHVLRVARIGIPIPRPDPAPAAAEAPPADPAAPPPDAEALAPALRQADEWNRRHYAGWESDEEEKENAKKKAKAGHDAAIDDIIDDDANWWDTDWRQEEEGNADNDDEANWWDTDWRQEEGCNVDDDNADMNIEQALWFVEKAETNLKEARLNLQWHQKFSKPGGKKGNAVYGGGKYGGKKGKKGKSGGKKGKKDKGGGKHGGNAVYSGGKCSGEWRHVKTIMEAMMVGRRP